MKPATTSAADQAAAAVAAMADPAAAPAHVESGVDRLIEDDDGDDDDTDRPTHADIERTLVELTKLDTRLRAEGHTLADVLATAAKNAYGVDVR